MHTYKLYCDPILNLRSTSLPVSYSVYTTITQPHMVTEEEQHIQVLLSVQTKEQKTGLPWEQHYCDNNDAIRVHCMEDTAPPLPGRHRHLVCPHW